MFYRIFSWAWIKARGNLPGRRVRFGRAGSGPCGILASGTGRWRGVRVVAAISGRGQRPGSEAGVSPRMVTFCS